MRVLQEIGLSPETAGRELVLLLLAFALALPIGWERGRGHRSVGFRTLPIVAVAACGFALIIDTAGANNLEARARVLQGVITGIGFIGGGAIVKTGGSVRGLLTAASIWNAGAIGLAVGLDRANIALALSVLNVVSLLAFNRLLPSRDKSDQPKRENQP